MSRRFWSLIGTAVLLASLFVGGGALSASAAGSKDYVVVVNDFEDKDRCAAITTYQAQPAALYQSATHAHGGKNSGLFVSQGAYGCVVDPSYDNKVSLTCDGEPMTANHSNVYDAIRVYILNPGREVNFRMQFTSSLGTPVFLDKPIPSSSDFVAYDFPLKDFHMTAPDSGKFFGKDATDPAHADIFEMLFVYVDAEANLKLYVDDLSFVKYNYTPAATKAPTVATTAAQTTAATASTTAKAAETTAAATVKTTAASAAVPTDKGTIGGASDDAGLPGWGIALIVVGVVVAAGGGTAAILLIRRKKAGPGAPPDSDGQQ